MRVALWYCGTVVLWYCGGLIEIHLSLITVECLRPHSPRLCFSDRVEFLPDDVESKRF